MVTEKAEGLSDSSKKKNLSEKRYLPRWAVANRLLYQLENDNKMHESSSRDISCTGASFTSAQELPLNKKIKMKIYLSEDNTIDVQGEIIWSKSLEAQHLIGVIFSNTSQKVQDLILKHAFEIKKEDVIKYWFQGWSNK